MEKYKHLAIDLGAGSGRAILGTIENSKLSLEIIHRFPNNPLKYNSTLHWDFDFLLNQLKKSLEKISSTGNNDLKSIAIDTWGVDFGLINLNGELIENPITYRDSRTDGLVEAVDKIIPRSDLFDLTGIQPLKINTLYQLYYNKIHKNDQLKRENKLLFMPDLFNYFISGEIRTDKTIASTSQLMDVRNGKWSVEIFEKLQLPLEIMPDISSNSVAKNCVSEFVNISRIPDLKIVFGAGHDTACAVNSIPIINEHTLFISSGSWSLLGIIINEPIINQQSFNSGFTNEIAFPNKIRFLKNIPGMWIFEQCRIALETEGSVISYEELINEAERTKPFKCFINPEDHLFYNPPNMFESIRKYCKKTGQYEPINIGEIVRCIFESLALKYAESIEKLKVISQREFRQINIIGGGAQNDVLNKMIAEAVNMIVVAGPIEGTAVGNILIQAESFGEIHDETEKNKIINNSFQLKKYSPTEHKKWAAILEQFKKLSKMNIS